MWCFGILESKEGSTKRIAFLYSSVQEDILDKKLAPFLDNGQQKRYQGFKAMDTETASCPKTNSSMGEYKNKGSSRRAKQNEEVWTASCQDRAPALSFVKVVPIFKYMVGGIRCGNTLQEPLYSRLAVHEEIVRPLCLLPE